MGAEMSGDRPGPMAHAEAVRRAEVEAARRALEAEAAALAAARATAKADAEKREEAAQRAHEKRLDDLVHGAAVRCTCMLQVQDAGRLQRLASGHGDEAWAPGVCYAPFAYCSCTCQGGSQVIKGGRRSSSARPVSTGGACQALVMHLCC